LNKQWFMDPNFAADQPSMFFLKTFVMTSKNKIAIGQTALLLLMSLLAWSQKIRGLSGKITDNLSRPVDKASVYILNTNRGTLTDANGIFFIPGIEPGNYTMEVSAIGYATINRNIHISGKEQQADLQLNNSSVQLDAISVTAQKKEEPVRNVPFSITALSSKQVNEYHLWNTGNITAIVPNLCSADPGDKRNVTSIRGITTTSYDPAVATYIDGVNQFGLDTYISQLFDVERIEILRGPQGTLYGRNAMGGVINIITKQPANTTAGFAEASVGNDGQQRYSAGIRMPVKKDRLFAGISGVFEKSNGFYTNQFNNTPFDRQTSFTGNYYLKFLPNARWNITLNAKNNLNRNHGTFPLVNGAGEAFAHPFKLNQNAIAKITDNVFNTSLSINHFNAHLNFSSQTAYQINYRYYDQPIDGDFSPADAVTIVNNYGNKWNKIKVITQEFKFSSPAASTSPLTWTAGNYIFYQYSPNKQATHFGEDGELCMRLPIS